MGGVGRALEDGERVRSQTQSVWDQALGRSRAVPFSAISVSSVFFPSLTHAVLHLARPRFLACLARLRGHGARPVAAAAAHDLFQNLLVEGTPAVLGDPLPQRDVRPARVGGERHGRL